MTRGAQLGGSSPRREARGPHDREPQPGLDGGLRALALAVQRLQELLPAVDPSVLARLARAVDAALGLAAAGRNPEQGQLPPLSRREREAVSRAALGETNKVIAFELGVSASTVGVLLHRAARKLGVRTRAELVERFRQMRPSAPGPATPAAPSALPVRAVVGQSGMVIG